MADQSILQFDLQSFPNCIAPTTVGAYAAGTPVRASGQNGAVPGLADSDPDAHIIGLLVRPSAAGEPCPARFVGPLQMTTAEWDAIAGTSGGLTPNAVYFLSPTTAGHITSTKPTTSGQVVEVMGIALSSTILLIQIRPELVPLGGSP